jgi:hypothetical protein
MGLSLIVRKRHKLKALKQQLRICEEEVNVTEI